MPSQQTNTSKPEVVTLIQLQHELQLWFTWVSPYPGTIYIRQVLEGLREHYTARNVIIEVENFSLHKGIPESHAVSIMSLKRMC